MHNTFIPSFGATFQVNMGIHIWKWFDCALVFLKYTAICATAGIRLAWVNNQSCMFYQKLNLAWPEAWGWPLVPNDGHVDMFPKICFVFWPLTFNLKLKFRASVMAANLYEFVTSADSFVLVFLCPLTFPLVIDLSLHHYTFVLLPGVLWKRFMGESRWGTEVVWNETTVTALKYCDHDHAKVAEGLQPEMRR